MTSIPVASPPVGVSVVPSAYDPLIAAAVVANGEAPSAGVMLASSQGTVSVLKSELVWISDTQ